MAVLHRRVDKKHSFYLRARIRDHWVTYQLTAEAEELLLERGYGDGDTIDRDTVDELWGIDGLRTGGSGPGAVAEGGRGGVGPAWVTPGRWARHKEHGIGVVRSNPDGTICNMEFLGEHGMDGTQMPVDIFDLSKPPDIEVARERELARRRKAKRDRPVQQPVSRPPPPTPTRGSPMTAAKRRPPPKPQRPELPRQVNVGAVGPTKSVAKRSGVKTPRAGSDSWAQAVAWTVIILLMLVAIAIL